jgi:hypothetical protein
LLRQEHWRQRQRRGDRRTRRPRERSCRGHATLLRALSVAGRFYPAAGSRK